LPNAARVRSHGFGGDIAAPAILEELLTIADQSATVARKILHASVAALINTQFVPTVHAKLLRRNYYRK
jgi:hypothetical protein